MIKIKPLTKEQILISLDRLTRFKNPETKYLRVFKDIITCNLINPKYKKSQLEKMDYLELKNLAEQIINESLKNLKLSLNEDFTINQRLYDYEKSTFNLTKETEILLKNKINYMACMDLIDENQPVNMQWLKNLAVSNDILKDREKYGLKYPVEKLVISEGITEEILLPEFAKVCNYDFDKKGVYMVSAGGKNQVVKLFYQLSEIVKIPIFILLDKDALSNYKEIEPKLRAIDKVHVLKCGEFEDLLPLNLIKRTLANVLKNISMIELEFVNQNLPMVEILEEIFRHRGMHEFKKSEFAHSVKENMLDENDISLEIKEIINEISKIKSRC